MSSLSPFRSLAWALLASTSLACSDVGSSEQPLALGSSLACDLPSFATCDIVEAACQRRIAEIAACQWGGPEATVVLPVVTLLSQEQYREQLGKSAAPNERTLQVRGTVDASLALLGLIDGGDLSLESVADRNAAGVLAYYDPPSKSITVIEHGSATDQLEANATLLHEMIHALQDTAHDLDGLRSAAYGSSDGDLALRSLVEGEAKFHDLLFTARLADGPLSPELLRQQLARRRVDAEDALFQSPSVLASTLQSVPYVYGPDWILERWLEGGSAAVQAAYEAVPTDLLGVLHSSWGAAQAAPTPTAYPAANVYTSGDEPAEDSEVMPLAYDRLGAFTVYTAARLAGDAATAQQLALAWRGDQLDVYELDAGGAAARWHLTFDTTRQATTFAALLEHSPNISVRHQGTSVVAVVSESGAKPEWLFGPAAQ